MQPGATMKSCMECELQSGYKKEGGISDLQALLCEYFLVLASLAFRRHELAKNGRLTVIRQH